jgi:hypothetical protein
MELEPVFVDVAIRRWQKASGQEAVLDGDGRTWAIVAGERGVETPDSETAPTAVEAGGAA